jgi:hypothetical protein
MCVLVGRPLSAAHETAAERLGVVSFSPLACGSLLYVRTGWVRAGRLGVGGRGIGRMDGNKINASRLFATVSTNRYPQRDYASKKRWRSKGGSK